MFKYKKNMGALVGVAAIVVGSYYAFNLLPDIIIQEPPSQKSNEAIFNPPKTSMPVYSGLPMTASQLRTDLGIGNSTPRNPHRFFAFNGWKGSGIYDFKSADFITPYLSQEMQLNNWNYILFRVPRRDPNTKEQQPVAPEIRATMSGRAKELAIYVDLLRRRAEKAEQDAYNTMPSQNEMYSAPDVERIKNEHLSSYKKRLGKNIVRIAVVLIGAFGIYNTLKRRETF